MKFFFFFQAEDGIRDRNVTGVQTCALPISGGKDPFEFRRKLLANAPRHRGVLELAAEKAGWGKPLPVGRTRGIAVVESFGSFVAEVAEVSVSRSSGEEIGRAHV